MKTIERKAWPEYFRQIMDGKKTFDLRLNDFDIEEGNILHKATLDAISRFRNSAA
jgi:hypothetical protein